MSTQSETEIAAFARALTAEKTENAKLRAALQGLLEWAEEYLKNDKVPTYDALHPARMALQR